MTVQHRFPRPSARRFATITAIWLAMLVASPWAMAGVLDDIPKFVEEYRELTVYVRIYKSQDRIESNLAAQGSGVLFDSGYVLTSLHLAEGVSDENLPELFAYGSIGSPEEPQYRLEYIDEETRHDLMLLRFHPDRAAGLAQACVRETATVAGEEIAILGFPLGGSILVSTGEVARIEAARIETTATIAPGSSGSPVFDDDGKVIGIARAERRSAGQGSDIYVIVPIKRAANLLNQIESSGQDNCEPSTPPPDQESMLRSAEATATASGESGTLAPRNRQTATIGQMAEASGRGAEQSDCDESDERMFSEATAQGAVEEDGNTGLSFMYRLNAQGGHYRTADGCFGNVLVGIHGNDTRSEASVDLLGRVRFTLNNKATVRVSWRGFEQRTAVLEIRGPAGDAPDVLLKELGDLGFDTNEHFQLSPTRSGQAYEVSVRVRDDIENTGACCPESRAVDATIEIDILN